VISFQVYIILTRCHQKNCTFTTHQLKIVPEIGMSRNSVQVHQFLQEPGSAVPTYVPRLQDQRGSKVAEGIKESVSPQSQVIYKREIKKDQALNNTIKSSNCRRYQARIVYSTLLESFKNSARSALCSA
jgi:hypothetical protein